MSTDQISDPAELRRRALSRWDNEGGAIAQVSRVTHPDIPDMTNAELVQLRIRVIALENLMIAVLAEGSNRQRQMACDMAKQILPRSSSTQHPLTIQASDHMTDLVQRADHFRTMSS